MSNNISLIWLTLCLVLSIVMPILVISVREYPVSLDPSCNKPEPKTLGSDQMTVVISGYSEHRIPLLLSMAATYSAAPPVASVIILWCNPSTAPGILSAVAQNLSSAAVILRAPSSSLNHRFYPWRVIKTRAVLICDDDIRPDPVSLSFAFTVWKSDPDRLIGFFARSHAYDVVSKTWIYTMDREKYSIILTKFMIINIKHLVAYSCSEKYAKARRIVEETNNCEDILMNFVVADVTEHGPVIVGSKRGGIRDYGDPRNDNDNDGVSEVGLSSRVREHRKRRGECIKEFHRVLGNMPLKYSYGKVIDGGGSEQGLCEKNGKLILCDQHEDYR